MEPRESYKLAYRIERCEDALQLFAAGLSGLDFEELTAYQIYERIMSVKQQMEAFIDARTTLETLTYSAHFRANATISFSNRDEPPQCIMRNTLDDYLVASPNELRSGWPSRYRLFLNSYYGSLLHVREMRLRNPNRFQVRHHWTTKNITLSAKGEAHADAL